MTASRHCLYLQLILLLLQQYGSVSARSINFEDTPLNKSSNISNFTCENNTVSVYELPSIQDVTVDQINYHNINNDLAVGRMRRYVNARALLKFEDLPKSCKLVVNAEMHLYYNRTYQWKTYPYVERTKSVEVRQVVRAWTEKEAMDAISSNDRQWRNSFLAMDTMAAKTKVESFYNITDSFTPPRYMSFDITDLAQRWLIGQENYGVMLSLADEKTVGPRPLFYSREAGPEIQPYLRVKCWSEYCASLSQKTGSETNNNGELKPTAIKNPAKPGTLEGFRAMSAEGASYTLPANSYTRKH